MEDNIKYNLEEVIKKIKEKDSKEQLRTLFDLIDNLKDQRNAVRSEYEEAKRVNFIISHNINNYIKAMYLSYCLSTLNMYIEYLDSYLDELISNIKQ